MYIDVVGSYPLFSPGLCKVLISLIDHNAMLRAFMYLGFQMIDPSVYGQEAGYILVGYEL